MSFNFTDLKLALPILILNGGKVSSDQMDLINSLSEAPIVVDFATLAEFSESCKEKSIEVPERIKLQFIYCSSIDEYIDISSILTRNYGIPFFSSFATLVIIDYSLNPKIQSVRNSISQLLPKRYNTGFVYYKATEDIISLFAEDTHISFTSYGKSGLKSHLIQFTTTIAFKGIMNDSDFVNYIAHITNKSSKATVVKMMPCCLSFDNNDVIKAITQALKEQENSEDFKTSIVIYEIIGILEQSEPGICKRNKLLERVQVHQLQSPWMDDQGPENDAVTCFSIAGSFANKSHMSNRMIDQGLHVISMGFTRYAETLSVLIDCNAGYTDMHLRALALVDIFAQMNKHGKAAFYAHKFSQSFPEYKMRFQLQAVKMLSHGCGGNLVMTKIAAPIILELTKQPVESSEMAALILNVLAQVGPSLPTPLQKSFFKKLSQINMSSVVESKLGFEIRSFEQGQSTYLIRKNNLKRRPSKSYSDVFIYNCLQKKEKKAEMIAIINEPFKFYVTIFNPFCGSVPATILVPDQPTLRTERKIVLLKPESETKVELSVKPTSLQPFTIKTLSCNVFCSSTTLTLPEPVSADVAPPTGIFCARTDFVSRTYFIGESIKFNVWITNCGKSTITRASVSYEGDTNTLQNELLPSRQACISCETTAEPSYDSIEITVACSGDDNSFESYKVINIPYKAIPGIIPCSLTAIREQVDNNNQSLDKVIYLSLGIANKSSMAFTIKASFDDNKGIVEEGNKAFLSSQERNDIVSAGNGITYIIPVLREKLNNCDNLATAHQLVYANSQMEEKLGRKLTPAERARVSKLTNIGCYIYTHLNLTWFTMDGNSGKLPQFKLPSEDILDELETVREIPKITVIGEMNEEEEEEGEKQAKRRSEFVVPCSELVTLRVDFGKMRAKECELDIGQYIDPKYGILWDGNLLQQGEGPTFDYKLCFTQISTFDVCIRYVSSTGIKGKLILTVKVVDGE